MFDLMQCTAMKCAVSTLLKLDLPNGSQLGCLLIA
jgi:hypothetical protein